MLVKLRSKPYPFQARSVEQIEEFRGRVLVALEMGLGKCLIFLMYSLNHPELSPVIVVCPASIKWNWRNEIIKHTGMRCEILEGNRPYELDTIWKPRTIWIINYAFFF